MDQGKFVQSQCKTFDIDQETEYLENNRYFELRNKSNRTNQAEFGLFSKTSIKRWTCIGEFKPISTFVLRDELFLGEEYNLWAQMIICECLGTFSDDVIYPFKLFHPRSAFPKISIENQEVVISKLSEKLKLNSFVMETENKLNVYISPSFANHSCTPNITCHVREDVMYFFAIKDISKDEEITIHYLPNSTNTRDNLLIKYGFDCTCSSCLSGESSANYEKWISNNLHNCQVCGKESSDNLKCGQCKYVYYCSEKCQRADWLDGNHRYKCNQLKITQFKLK